MTGMEFDMAWYSGTKKFKQTGSALIIALIVMVLVSVLGLTAIRSSNFSVQVATGIQADAMTFEAAETIIASTYNTLSALDDNELYDELELGRQSCMTKDGLAAGVCGDNDFMDERSLIKGESLAYFDGYQAIEGHQVSVTGSGVLFVDYKTNILSTSEMETFNIQNNHLQESLKKGLKAGSELD